MTKFAIESLKVLLGVLMKAFVGFIVVAGVLLLLLLGYALSNRIPATNMQFAHVDRDTTFYIGESGSGSNAGGHLSVRVVGDVDDSSAVIAIFYPAEPTWPTWRIKLQKGRLDTLVTNDFYDQRARLLYQHKAVRRGHLKLQAVFSFPPEEWPFRWEKDRWKHTGSLAKNRRVTYHR